MIVIKGAGDLASGVAVRLLRCGFPIVMTDLPHPIVMTDLPHPTSIRRTVCFSEAILKGTFTVEDVTAAFAEDLSKITQILSNEQIAVLADPNADCIRVLL